MTNATFDEHPIEPNKVILRKKSHLDKGRDYEEGFIDGMQYQMQSSVDKAVNAMSRTWIGLTEEEIDQLLTNAGFTRSDLLMVGACVDQVIDLVANKLKEKNA